MFVYSVKSVKWFCKRVLCIHVCADMAELSEGAVFDQFESLNIALTNW